MSATWTYEAQANVLIALTVVAAAIGLAVDHARDRRRSR